MDDLAAKIANVPGDALEQIELELFQIWRNEKDRIVRIDHLMFNGGQRKRLRTAVPRHS